MFIGLCVPLKPDQKLFYYLYTPDEIKKEIVDNWLPRYTGVPLERFGEYIILVNFNNYVELFAQWHHVPVEGVIEPMDSATAENITIINFGMGSPNAATIMDLLSAIKPKACIF